jgi:hypothetical protein
METRYYTRHTRIPGRFRNEKYTFNSYGILIERRTGREVVANPRTAETPKLKKINGQEFYNGKICPMVRSKMIREMQAFYRKHIPTTTKIDSPCKLRLEIHSTRKEGEQDMGNMSWVMVKVISDAMVDNQILPEDTDRVLKGFEVDVVPVDDPGKRKLVLSLLPFTEQDEKEKEAYHELL